MKRIFFLLALCILSARFLVAEVSLYTNLPGSKAAGTGFAVDYSDEASQLYEGVVFRVDEKNKWTFDFLFSNLLLDIKQTGVVSMLNLKVTRLTMGIVFNNYRAFEGYEENLIEEKEVGEAYPFGAYDLILPFNVTTVLGSNIRIGLSLLPAIRKIESEFGYGVATSVGIVYEKSKFLIKASLNNVGPKFYMMGQYQSLPSKFRTGVEYRIKLKNFDMKSGLAVNMPFNNPVYVNLGLDVELKKIFNYRLGWQFNRFNHIDNSAYGFSTGFSAKLKNYEFSYSYQVIGTIAETTFMQGLSRIDLVLKF